jgi:hypothetical protein
MNTNLVSPGLFLKDSNGDLVKVGPVHVGTTAPNATPGAGGQAGNSKGEQWLDTSSSRYVFKIWDGTAWRTEDGEFVNSSGDTMTGALIMDNQQQVRFRETTANGTNYIALQAPASVASDKTITLPDVTGTVVTTGDTGSVTSTMLLDGTILNADINASAAIVDTKLDTIATAGKVSNSATTATNANTASAIVARDASGNFSAGTITAALTGNASTVTTNANLTGDVTSVGNATSIASGVIVNADVNASAAIAGTKISPDFGSQTIATTGVFSHALGAVATPSITFTGDLNTGIYSPGADQVAISTNGTGRLFVDASGNVGFGTATPGTLAHLRGNSNVALRIEDSTGSYCDLNYNDSGTVSALSISADPANTGADTTIRFNIDNSERARIDSSGRLGLGTISPGKLLEVSSSTDATIRINDPATVGTVDRYIGGVEYYTNDSSGGAKVACSIKGYHVDVSGNGRLQFATGNETTAVTIDGSQRVGIGTTSPGAIFHTVATSVAAATVGAFLQNSDNTAGTEVRLALGPAAANLSDNRYAWLGCVNTGGSNGTALTFATGPGGTAATERARIDSSGRFLVGTSTSRTADGYASGLQLEGTTNFQSASISLTHNRADTGAPEFRFCKSRGTSAGAVTLVNSGDILGRLYFYGTDGSAAIQAARISAEVDGTPGANDMPGRLVFSTTADGASSPTERMRIDSSGNLLIGQSTTTTPGLGNNTTGSCIDVNGTGFFSRAAVGLRVNRTADGVVAVFTSAGVEEGNISIAGNTVSYNQFLGSHWAALSDWSRPSIKIGTVMETINELVDWKYVVIEVEGEQKKICYNGTAEIGSTVTVEYEGEEYDGIVELETNPDFNKAVKVKVNNTAASKAVYGVFVAWNVDGNADGGIWNDMYVGAVGNYVIRMAAGQEPEIGDLVEADGTGCAVVQDDDIIRTKTVAKITTVIPQVTYDDGSFLVTCVLYCG